MTDDAPSAEGPEAVAGASVYQRVLGDRFAELDPQLQAYFGPLPPGAVGRGSGVYDVAGSRIAALRPLLRWLAWRRILFPEHGVDVPFTIENRAGRDGELRALRTFSFPGATRCMEDAMSVVDGCLVDRLGRRGGLEVALDVSVSGGGLRMTSGRLTLRLFGLRIPLPPVADVTLSERADTTMPGRQHVDVRITAPLLGEVFRYAGAFTYGHAPASPG